jgi:integrase
VSRQLKETKSKAGRRGNQEGSIYQRKSDGRWCGAVTVGIKPNGKPDIKVFYAKTRQDIAKKVAAKTAEVFENGYTNTLPKADCNFQLQIETWSALYTDRPLDSGTIEKHRNRVRHTVREFGTLDLADITTDRLQEFFNAKSRSGMCYDSISKIKNLLKNFFDYAYKRGLVGSNPMLDVTISKSGDESESKGKALRSETRMHVLQLVGENPILKPIVSTLMMTGLRPQEIIALQWSNVDLEHKTLCVSVAVKRTAEFGADGEVVSRSAKIGSTKSKKSIRTIILPDSAVEALNEWVAYCAEHDIASEFVFPNTKTGGMRTYSGLRSLLNRFLKRHGLDGEGITLYTFRHTFATVLLEERENPRIVADLMGHEKTSTTLDIYSRVVDRSVYAKTAQTLDKVYSKPTSPKPASEKM